MPGAITAVGMVGCAAALTVGLVTSGAAAVFAQRLAGTADAAALAAADAAAGAVAGVPCELAARLAEASAAVLARCEVDGLIADVTLTARFGAFTAMASARAGPPG